MKKVLALVLAFVMVAGMATVAFAASKTQINDPVLDATIMKYDSDNKVMDTQNISYVPGNKYYFPVMKNTGTAANPTYVNVDKATDSLSNYKVSYTVDEGKKVLDSVKLVTKKVGSNEWYFIEVATKDNMILDDQDLDINSIKLVATKPSYNDGIGVAAIDETFAYTTTTPAEVCALKGKLVEFENYSDDEWVDMDMYFGADEDIHFDTRMYKQADMYLKFSDDDVDKYLELYPEAALNFYSFTQPKAFKQAGTLYIPAAMTDEEKAPHLYEEKDGKLVEIKNAYDKDNEEFVLKNIKTLGKYIVSDVDLEVKAAEGDKNEDNPETGANDVVAIAAGLAVVSLVAAGAVSLKK